MDERWRVSHVELLEGGACFLGSCFTTKRPGRVFRSATRITRKRTWAAIMLRQRLRTQSKFSVAELGKPSCLTSEINDESRRGPTSVNELKRQGVQIVFARVSRYLRSDMDRHHIMDAVSEKWIFATLHEAMAALQVRSAQSPPL